MLQCCGARITWRDVFVLPSEMSHPKIKEGCLVCKYIPNPICYLWACKVCTSLSLSESVVKYCQGNDKIYIFLYLILHLWQSARATEHISNEKQKIAPIVALVTSRCLCFSLIIHVWRRNIFLNYCQQDTCWKGRNSTQFRLQGTLSSFPRNVDKTGLSEEKGLNCVTEVVTFSLTSLLNSFSISLDKRNASAQCLIFYLYCIKT